MNSLLAIHHLPPINAFLAGAILSWILLLILIPILRRQLLDHPNPRSAHSVPVPRGGGVSFVFVSSLLAPLSGPTPMSWIPLVSVPLAIVGIFDDRFGLSAGFRFSAQLITGLILIKLASLPMALWILPVILVVIVAIINFVNFMDGLDGLVATCCALVLATAAFDPLISSPSPVTLSTGYLWPLIGSIIGFLFWNWSPARVFMGDVGSTFLGAVLAGTILQQTTIASAIGLLFVGFPMFADTLVCVLRRLHAHQPVFKAHKLHLFQRLHQAGWSHRQVTMLYGTATALLGLAYLSGYNWFFVFLLSIEISIAYWLDTCIASPFLPNDVPAITRKS